MVLGPNNIDGDKNKLCVHIQVDNTLEWHRTTCIHTNLPINGSLQTIDGSSMAPGRSVQKESCAYRAKSQNNTQHFEQTILAVVHFVR